VIIDEEAYLDHHGVKGMHWGSRKGTATGASRAVDRHAQRDAKEFARAKAFYGEGAGTRRKLIKATVEGKSKRLPGYQKAFDHHLSKQDSSKHASKAVSERSSIDRKTRTKQRAGAIARRVTGERGTQAALVAAAAGGAAYLNSPRGRAHLAKGAHRLRHTAETIKRKKGAAHISNFIKNSM
jgi:hypothetical protein